MAMEPHEWMWHQGNWCRWEDAKVHMTAHVLHYGSSVFEGIRCYDTPRGPAVFRLREHMVRLVTSCKLMRMNPLPFDVDWLVDTTLELLRKNGKRECYIRPLAYRGAGQLGVNPFGAPIEITLMSYGWGQYLGEGAVENGVEACISSWRRIDSSSNQPIGKIGGQYVNSQLASIEAKQGGFTEGILLDSVGHVAEGAGQNIFLVWNGVIWTPPEASSILVGITRDTVLQLARDRGLPIRVEQVSREMLHLAEEVFFTGTASEITPVKAIDRLPVGNGKPGPITKSLQKEFFDYVRGQIPDRHNWLEPIGVP